MPSVNLDQILSILELVAASLPVALPGSAGIDAVAVVLLKIAQQAVMANEALTGQTLDLTKLHDLPLVP